jgi:hypothetical protein
MCVCGGCSAAYTPPSACAQVQSSKRELEAALAALEGLDGPAAAAARRSSPSAPRAPAAAAAVGTPPGGRGE